MCFSPRTRSSMLTMFLCDISPSSVISRSATLGSPWSSLENIPMLSSSDATGEKENLFNIHQLWDRPSSKSTQNKASNQSISHYSCSIGRFFPQGDFYVTHGSRAICLTATKRLFRVSTPRCTRPYVPSPMTLVSLYTLGNFRLLLLLLLPANPRGCSSPIFRHSDEASRRCCCCWISPWKDELPEEEDGWRFLPSPGAGFLRWFMMLTTSHSKRHFYGWLID